MNGGVWPGKSQQKVGLSSSNDFGMPSSHVVSRDDYAFSTSSFEALSMVLAAMGTYLKLCLVHVCDLI